MNKGRLEAFSDGVFAIVITLLILDVRLPPGVHVSIGALWQLLPRLATFVLSFVVVGVYWVAHHNMMHFIERVDRSLLWLNLLLPLSPIGRRSRSAPRKPSIWRSSGITTSWKCFG